MILYRHAVSQSYFYQNKLIFMSWILQQRLKTHTRGKGNTVAAWMAVEKVLGVGILLAIVRMLNIGKF